MAKKQTKNTQTKREQRVHKEFLIGLAVLMLVLIVLMVAISIQRRQAQMRYMTTLADVYQDLYGSTDLGDLNRRVDGMECVYRNTYLAVPYEDIAAAKQLRDQGRDPRRALEPSQIDLLLRAYFNCYVAKLEM